MTKTRRITCPLLIASALMVGAYILRPGEQSSGPADASGGQVSHPTQLSSCQTGWANCKDNRDLVEHYSEMPAAIAACRAMADSRSKYGTPEWPWLKFGQFKAGDDFPKTGLITIIEPEAKFQNGFGAMERVTVGCLYDLRSRHVIDVGISEP